MKDLLGLFRSTVISVEFAVAICTVGGWYWWRTGYEWIGGQIDSISKWGGALVLSGGLLAMELARRIMFPGDIQSRKRLLRWSAYAELRTAACSGVLWAWLAVGSIMIALYFDGLPDSLAGALFTGGTLVFVASIASSFFGEQRVRAIVEQESD